MSNNKSIENYENLQALYLQSEINENCVDIDFGYAFICAMASSEFDLQQWMPLLFTNGESQFSNEQLASKFAQAVLAIYQQAHVCFENGLPLTLMVEQSVTPHEHAIFNFSAGYLQALTMIDNMQMHQFEEGSQEANLQQTCFLLLDKLATDETEDPQKLAIFAQLPTHNEIAVLLPELLSHYGALCLGLKNR